MSTELQPITLKETAAPSNPPTGHVALYSVDGTALLMKDDAGVVSRFSPDITVHNASVANQGAGFATDTYVTGSYIPFPVHPSGSGNRLKAGSKYRLTIHVSKTAVGTAQPVITVRVGTAGTTADTSRLTLTHNSQAANADFGVFDVILIFRTVGASATLQGGSKLDHQSFTSPSFGGFSVVPSSIVTALSGTFDSTTANLGIGVSINGGTSANWTMQIVDAELTNLT